MTRLLTRLLTENVKRVLGDAATVTRLATAVVEEFAKTGEVEVAAAGELAAALKAAIAAKGAVKVVTDDTLDKGFSVRLDGGRVEHSFTGDVVAEELSRRLRPELARLVQGK